MADAASNGATRADSPSARGQHAHAAVSRGHRTFCRCTKCGAEPKFHGFKFFERGLTVCDRCRVSPPPMRLVPGYYGIGVMQAWPNE